MPHTTQAGTQARKVQSGGTAANEQGEPHGDASARPSEHLIPSAPFGANSFLYFDVA
jgi:hypothetical protein